MADHEHPGDCNDALHEIYHFLHDELTPDTRSRIQQHLDDCPPCYETYDFEAELRTVIARKCIDSVPESLRQRIADAIQHETLPPH